MKIHFVRHSEADYDLEKQPGEFPGVPLTAEGEQQAKDLARELRDFKLDHLFCSDMQRTKQTISPFLVFLSKKPLYDSRLREISQAVTQGHDDNWFEEPVESQIERMDSFLDYLKSLSGEILIVAHFGVIKYMTKKLGYPVESPEYAGHYVVDLGI